MIKSFLKQHIAVFMALFTVLIAPSFSYGEEKTQEELLREEKAILEKLNILKTGSANKNKENDIQNDDEDTDEDIIEVDKIVEKKVKEKSLKKDKQDDLKVNTPTSTPTKSTATKKIVSTETLALNELNETPINKIEQQVTQVPTVSCDKENRLLLLANQKIEELSKELENKKRQLILVETEVERLSEVIERRNKAELTGARQPSNSNVRNSNTNNMNFNSANRQPAMIQRYQPKQETEFADMPVAIVIVDKANLRAGPSFNDSPLLEVSKGTRLVVETRQGSWYRVMAPNGKRAWVSSEVVNFGASSRSNNSYSTRIRGYDQNAESMR